MEKDKCSLVPNRKPEWYEPMKMTNKILSTALSLGLIVSPIAAVNAKDASKETVSPQRAKVGTGTAAGQTDGGGTPMGVYVAGGVVAAVVLAVVLESALDGKKDPGGVGTLPPGGPPATTPPATTPPATTPPATTSTGTGTGTGN